MKHVSLFNATLVFIVCLSHCTSRLPGSKTNLKGSHDREFIKENHIILNSLSSNPEYVTKLKSINPQVLDERFKKMILDFRDTNTEHKRLEKVKDFWSSHTTTDNLAGNKNLRNIDESGTKKILEELEDKKLINPKENYILELAAGNGRISKNIFSKHFKNIDALEPGKTLAQKIKDLKTSIPQIKDVYAMKGEDFNPGKEKKYDVVFASWFLENMTDKSALKFLIKIKENIKKGGVFILKENIVQQGATLSTTNGMAQRIRNIEAYHTFFELAGYKVLIDRNTKGWPGSYFMLREFVIQNL